MMRDGRSFFGENEKVREKIACGPRKPHDNIQVYSISKTIGYSVFILPITFFYDFRVCEKISVKTE